MLIFSIESYYGDQLCSKCIKKSLVSYPVHDIQGYQYNILMTIQSAIASTVTVIAGILVCIVVGLPKGLTFSLHDPVSCTSVYVSNLKSSEPS